MLNITKSQLRRLTATILLGCVVLLPAFIARAETEVGTRAATTTVALSFAAAL